jgi:hypothetical protein
LKRSCLGALYMANSESIQNHCRFKITEAREKISELSKNTWAVYSVGTISTNEVCPAANAVTAMQIQSGDTIRIKPGCYVRTMDHVISANESETIEVTIKMMDWAGEITDLFHYGNKEGIHQAVQRLWTRYNGEFDATILLDQLDQLKIPDTHWTFASPAAMIGAAICLFGFFLPLEMLLQKHNGSTASTFRATDADASDLASTSQRTQDSAKPRSKEQRQPQQPEPRRRGEISETIYL